MSVHHDDCADIQLDSLTSSAIRTITLCDQCTHSIRFEDCRASNEESLKQVSRTFYDSFSNETTNALHRKAASIRNDAHYLALEISRLRSTLSELEDAHAQLERCATHMAGLPAAIRRLPVDVLGEIFSSAVENECMRRYPSTLPIQTLCLSQVCHLWRCITTSSPKLWAFTNWSINLDILPGGYTNLISYYLEMSRPLPLSLQLVTFFIPSLEILRVVVFHLSRLHHVQIRLTSSLLEAMDQVLRSKGDRPVDGHFPNLEEVDLSGSEDLIPNLSILSENSSLASSLFAIAPKLRSLVLDSFTGTATTFPYVQLEKLTLDTFSAHTDWKTISKFGLKTLILLRKDVDTQMHWSSDANLPIHFPTISCLQISISTRYADCDDTLAMLFGGLVFPSLKTFHLCSIVGGHHLGPLAFKPLISQPQSLLELCLEWPAISCSDFRNIFLFVPRLTRLTYHGRLNGLKNVVEILTVQKTTVPQTATLLPALLHLDVGVVENGIMNAITAMTLSRSGQSQSDVVSLESIALTFADFADIHIPYEMQVLCHSTGILLEGRRSIYKALEDDDLRRYSFE